jgi:hypothetical protein
MNFLKAVKSLQEGLCEGIKHPEWTQKHAPQHLVLSDNENELDWSNENLYFTCQGKEYFCKCL